MDITYNSIKRAKLNSNKLILVLIIINTYGRILKMKVREDKGLGESRKGKKNGWMGKVLKYHLNISNTMRSGADPE